MSQGFELLLRSGIEAGSHARRAIAANDLALPPAVQDDVWLLVTELVTNAVLHSGTADDRPIKVALEQDAGRVRVEVVDPGTDFEQPAEATTGDASGGWGLFLVNRIAEQWGVRPTPTGTCVWFEMPDAISA
jgi:anti-sigma regulatory factor (Ser/Thr protein kinase)